MLNGQILKGVIITYLKEKQFGFIRCPKLNEDVYFHLKNFRSLVLPKEEMVVQFELKQTIKGYAGLNVKVVGDGDKETK